MTLMETVLLLFHKNQIIYSESCMRHVFFQQMLAQILINNKNIFHVIFVIFLGKDFIIHIVIVHKC